MLAIADNRGNIIAPLVARPVNVHDSKLFYESFTNLLEIADLLDLEIRNSHLTLDSGFDNAETKSEIIFRGLVPVIKPNPRGTKNREKIQKILEEFKSLESIYKERHNIERCFAWEDTYRKLAVRYEKLQSTFMGFRYLSYSMINFRWVFGKN
ncbi:MAG: transposase [Ignavibacteria bacterium]|nr:transposase [Ignavibacteria bacterium]